MAKVTVDGKEYDVGALSPLDQYDVAARFSFVLINMLGVQAKPGEDAPSPARFARVICAMSSSLTPENRQAAVLTCLKAVKRMDTGRPAPVVAGGAIAYPDIQLQQMLELVWHVVKENRIADFFGVPPAETGGEGAGT